MRVGLLEEPEAAWVEAAAEVDQDVVEGRLHDLDDPLEVLEGDPEVGLGTGGRRQHVEPGAVGREVGSRQLGIGQRCIVTGESGDVVARHEVQVGGDLPELEVEVDQQDARRGEHPVRRLRGRARLRPGAPGQEHRGVDGERRGADSALRAEERDDLTGSGMGSEVGGDPTGSDEERGDPAGQLGRLEATGDHVIGAGLQERDAGLDVMSRRDDEDRGDAALGGDSERGDGAGSGKPFGHDQVDRVLAHRGDRIGRGRHRRDLVAGVGKRLLELGTELLGRGRR